MDKGAIDQMLREKTHLAVLESRRKWRERPCPVDKPPGSSLTFMGTGGNPEAVIGQKPRTAGFILDIGNLYMWVDPGPGALQAAQENNIDLGVLDAVYISHGHIDHYAGAESLVEGMCWAMSARRGRILGPKEIFEDEHVISEYHQGDSGRSGYFGGPEVIHLKPGKTIEIEGVLITPKRAYHGSQNYGFILEYKGFRLGYTGDTNYIRTYRTKDGIKNVDARGIIMDFEEIVEYRQDVKEAYMNVDVLIANITTHNAWAHRHITTLGLPHLLEDSKTKLVILSHFNYCCVEPEDLRETMAQYVEKASGIPTRPAYDGLKVELGKLIAGS
ncbi:MAG: MBL fold metallo-hydrolase [Desulfitobacterium hafniense]|nr:MBL fold metallo-hydrolase [Desulfitobacterium hafniense]